MKFLNKILPFAIIALVVIILAVINYKPGTILTGWDNLHPEFNLLLNIKRSFFAVWQEYQSLGLLGGMGHATDLVRQFFLLLLSLFLPQNFLRFFWTVLTLFIGGSGALALSSSLIKHSFFGRNKINLTVLPTVAGLFYILNLATIQSYYVPFETFTAHFAFLPWMIIASLHFFNRQNVKNALILTITLFLTTPQSYVPTLFVVTTLVFTILLTTAGIKLVKERRITKLLTMSAKYYAILFISNAFWLLPFAYFTFTNASTNVNAKINQMATEQIILQNKEFANIFDVMLLKGFWFNAIEPNLSRASTYMMQPWRQHLESPYILFVGFIFFAVILLGFVNIIRKKEILLTAFSVLFVFVVVMLAYDTPPFSYLNSAFTHIPLFSQAFRFPFTKFSILAGLLYSLFFVFGLGTIVIGINNLHNRLKPTVIKALTGSAITISIIGLVLFMLPAFQGKFFYEKDQLKLPKEYSQVFSFFDKKNQDARIVTLPMSTIWSWNYYTWGYGGSGFLWYGIKQPIVDRAFDSWSSTSENSYNELSYAIYSKDPQQLSKVLNKFQISYFLLDRNIYSNSSPKSLFYNETMGLLKLTPGVKKEVSYGNIDIYHIELKNKPQNFVITTQLLPSSNNQTFNRIDLSYKNLSNYSSSNTPSNYFPFGSLFSNKLYETSFKIDETKNIISFSATLPRIDSYTLVLPSLYEDGLVPVKIISQYDSLTESVLVSAQILTPKIQIENNMISENQPITYPLFVVPANAIYSFAINNVRKANIDLLKPLEFYTYLQLEADNYFSLSPQNTDQVFVQTISKDYLQGLPELKKKSVELSNIPEGRTISISFPKVIDSFNGYAYKGSAFKNIADCNEFRSGSISSKLNGTTLTLDALNDSICTSVDAPTLTHTAGYLVKLQTTNTYGRTLHFWTLNNDEGITPLDLYLDPKKPLTYLVVPPMEKFGVGYSFHVDNISVGKTKVRNSIDELQVVKIPYHFLTDISLSKTFKTYPEITTFTTAHPNESLYLLTLLKRASTPSTIILSQSFDPEWKAYLVQNSKFKLQNSLNVAFPFLFGKEIQTHMKVNGWENGWEIDPSIVNHQSSIIIIYLPQYLQYGGFLAFVLLVIIMPFGAYYRKLDNFFKNRTKILKNKIALMRSKKHFKK